jgi:hypothetical protein
VSAFFVSGAPGAGAGVGAAEGTRAGAEEDMRF